MTIIKGDAYILRTCRADMTSHGGFVWPREGMVEASDWNPTAECGNGLHGFLWGEGAGELADWSADAVWIVARVSEWVDLDGKVKFPRAEVVFAGTRYDATQEIVRRGARGAVIGATVSGGNGATVIGGYRSTVIGGDGATVIGGNGSTVIGGNGSTASGGNGATVIGGSGSTASGGDWSTVIGGNGATVSGGYRSTVSGGDWSTVSGGYGATVIGGDRSTVSGGYRSILQIQYFDGNRRRVSTAYVGENGIKPNTPYRLNDQHEFEEVTQ